MKLAVATPAPLPTLSTTGPKDWTGVPLASFGWADSSRSSGPLFASRDGFTRLDGVTSIDGALAAASRLSYSNGGATTAVGVLQAANGAFYLTQLGGRNLPATLANYFPRNIENVRVSSVVSYVDALKAVVGGTTWAKLDAPAGTAPTVVLVPAS